MLTPKEKMHRGKKGSDVDNIQDGRADNRQMEHK